MCSKKQNSLMLFVLTSMHRKQMPILYDCEIYTLTVRINDLPIIVQMLGIATDPHGTKAIQALFSI